VRQPASPVPASSAAAAIRVAAARWPSPSRALRATSRRPPLPRYLLALLARVLVEGLDALLEHRYRDVARTAAGVGVEEVRADGELGGEGLEAVPRVRRQLGGAERHLVHRRRARDPTQAELLGVDRAGCQAGLLQVLLVEVGLRLGSVGGRVEA